MHGLECAAAMLVEDSDEIDNGIGSVEQACERVGVVNVRSDQPDCVENPEIIVASRGARGDSNPVPIHREARDELGADKTCPAEDTDRQFGRA